MNYSDWMSPLNELQLLSEVSHIVVNWSFEALSVGHSISLVKHMVNYYSGSYNQTR